MSITDPEPAQANRAAPRAFWLIAQHFFHVLWTLFGNPEDLARRHTLTKNDYTLTLSWLRVAEALMRRLLLIEAAALTLPEARRVTRKSKRTRRRITYTADNPEHWRVSFRCPSSPARGGSVERRSRETKGEAPPAAPKFHSAWPLAERYEALVRAFNNPAPFARRLARRVKAELTRIAALLRAPIEAAHRVDNFENMGELAQALWPLAPTPDTS
jgi:hypothetical protein